MRSFTVVLWLAAASPVMAEELRTENVSQFIETAIANNPDVKSSEARWQMFKRRVPHEGVLADPMLTLKIQNGVVSDPFNFQKDTMTQKVIGISQQVPFWGKRDLKGELAAKEAESYGWLFEERKLELARMVKEAWFRLYLVDHQLEIVDRNVRIFDEFIPLAETKYSVGRGAQQDIYKAQLERAKLLDMRITLEQQRKSLQASLNALLYRPQDTSIGKIPDFTILPLAVSAGELKGIALDNRPLLKSLRALIEKGKVWHKLAEKDFYPDFNVSLEYMQRHPGNGDTGLDMYSLGVTFNLPIFKHHRHEMVAEADSTVRMAAEELNSLKNNIGSGIADLLALVLKARQGGKTGPVADYTRPSDRQTV